MNTPAIKKEPVYWIDLVRMVAVFLVVIIHVTERIINEWNQHPSDWQNIANAYDSLARISVPLFFMASGSLLLPKSENIKEFFTKRANKVFLPFIAWSVIYLFWGCLVNGNSCEADWLSHMVLIYGTYHHLWFMYPLLGLYLLTPVLRLLILPNNKNILWYFVGLWIVFQPMLSIAQEFWDFKIGISVPMATGYIGFFILGHLLGELRLSRILLIISAITWVVSTAGTGIATYYLSASVGKFDYFFYNYLSINVIISSAAGFLLLRWLSDQSWLSSGRVRLLTRKFATASFGIYLVHIIILEVMSGKNPFIHINTDMGNPLWSIPFVSIVGFMTSFFVIYVFQKIPIINRIVP